MSNRIYLVVWAAAVETLMLIALSTVRADDGSTTAANEERIRQTLGQNTSFDFVEAPLVKAVAYFAEKHDIPITIDAKALADVGITTDRPITKSLSGLSLRMALRNVLRDLELTFIIKDEVLMVTTPDEANKMLIRKIYDVHDLKPEGGYEKLVETLTSHIFPTSWNSVGGCGTISIFTANGIDALIITQTQEVHDDLGNLLADLRRLRKASKDKQ